MKRIPAALLGDLESAVMEYVWSHGECDVKAVHRGLGTKRGITLNTVQSTMQRLNRKGFLTRRKVSHAYRYAPSLSRVTFGTQALQQVVEKLLRGPGEFMLSAFVDLAARAGEDTLAQLERMIAERLKPREPGGK